ncbi:MAG: CooT family nickel-binding protein [Candidatus Bathyarchaeia archaeon]
MCEFKVILDEKVVMEDVIHARTEGDTTILQDVIGETSSLNGVKIVEVNVTKARLVLSRISSQS